MTKLACALILSFAVAGPARAEFRCPAKGGAPWRELKTAHFRLDTDAGEIEARSMARDLEHMHALLLQALLGEQVDLPGHVRVLAFSDPKDFREMSGQHDVTGYYTRARFGEPTIVLSAVSLRDNPDLVAHELAHHISFYLYPVQPPWFAEGLAEWVQTVAARARDMQPATGSHITHGTTGSHFSAAGLVPGHLVSWFQLDRRPMPVKEILAWNGAVAEANAGRGHLWSWTLYHYLWNKRSKAFSDYQKRLADSADPAESWRLAFPDYDPQNGAAMAALDAALADHLSSGRFTFYRVEAKADASFEANALSSSELHLLIFHARRGRPTPEQRASVVAEALAEDPGSPHAGVLQQMQAHEGGMSLEALRAAANGRPGDWIGWFHLGSTPFVPVGEREAALRKAVQLNPENALALNNLAWLLVTADRAREALPFANRSLDLAPWNAATVDTLAEVAARLGKCKQALQLARRAVRSDARLENREKEIAQRCK
jgi:hypothetical protein